jgi:hypothetical protein
VPVRLRKPSSGFHPCRRAAGRGSTELPLHALVERLRQPADLLLAVVVAVEVLAADERAGDEEGAVDVESSTVSKRIPVCRSRKW